MKAESRRHWIALVAVLLVGALFRFWDFGVVSAESLTVEPDSRDKVKLAEQTALGQDPNYYKHPRLLINTSAVLLKIGDLFGFRGRTSSARIMVAYMMVLSLATSVVLYFIGMTAFENRWIALMGAWLFTTAPVSIVGTHYIKEDVPLMFGCSLALLMMLRLVRRPRPVLYLWVWLLVGVAVGIKLVAAALVPVAIAAHLIPILGSPDPKERLVGRRFLLSILLVPVGFFLFNHQDLVHLGEFLSQAASQTEYAQTGHWDRTVFSPWTYWWTFQLRYGLFPGMTAAVSLAGIAGAALCLRSWRANPSAALLAAWTVGFYLLIESSSAKPFPLFARYLYPMMPGLALLAAYAVHRFALALHEFRGGRLAGTLVVAAVLAWPATLSSAIVAGFTPDTRVKAAKWADENLPKGARLLIDSWFYSPRFSERFDVERQRFCKGKWTLEESDHDYIVTNDFNYVRYFANEKHVEESKRRADCFRKLLNGCRVVKRFEPDLDVQTVGFHNPVITFLDRKSCKE